MNIRIDEADSRVAEQIEAQLLKSLQQTLVQSQNAGFVLSASSPQDSLIGGLTASTSYGWLLIKTLWIDDGYRKRGVGRLLVERAETKACNLGCHSAWLDTSNPDAKLFYEAVGYEEFGELSNESGQFPETHRRWFLRKTLKVAP